MGECLLGRQAPVSIARLRSTRDRQDLVHQFVGKFLLFFKKREVTGIVEPETRDAVRIQKRCPSSAAAGLIQGCLENNTSSAGLSSAIPKSVVCLSLCGFFLYRTGATSMRRATSVSCETICRIPSALEHPPPRERDRVLFNFQIALFRTSPPPALFPGTDPAPAACISLPTGAPHSAAPRVRQARFGCPS